MKLPIPELDCAVCKRSPTYRQVYTKPDTSELVLVYWCHNAKETHTIKYDDALTPGRFTFPIPFEKSCGRQLELPF